MNRLLALAFPSIIWSCATRPLESKRVEIVERWTASRPDRDYDFATDVQPIGDIDGDQTPDLLVAAPAIWWSTVPGCTYLISGRNGHTLRQIVGDLERYGLPAVAKPHPNCFGCCNCPLPDIDGDHVADFAVSDFGGIDGDACPPSAVWIFSGADGRMIHRFRKDNRDGLGIELTAAGDLDADGVCDLLALAGGIEPEYVESYSLRDGSLLYHVTVPQTRKVSWLTWTVLRSIDDIDHDGVRDFVAGTLVHDGQGESRLSLFSGRTGQTLELLSPDELVRLVDDSETLCVAGDLNDDGVADVVLARDAEPSDEMHSEIVVRSGKDGAVLASRIVSRMGRIAPLGDIDHDGSFELAVGQVGEIVPGDGVVRMYSVRGVR